MVDDISISIVIIFCGISLCIITYCLCKQIYTFGGNNTDGRQLDIHIEVNTPTIIVERNVSIGQIRNLENGVENSTQEDSVSINSSCSICSDRLKNPVVLPCCKNTVCLSCITEWIVNNPSCHLCRSSLKIKKDDMNMITEYLVVANV